MLRIVKWILFCALLLQLAHRGISQNTPFPFDQLNADDGLVSQYNDFTFKDSRGFVWLSSCSGLYRYNGLSIKILTPDAPGCEKMLGRCIQSKCIEDSHGNIWFTTLQGINRYTSETEEVVGFQIKNELGQYVNKDYNSFYLERDTFLWTLADTNIYKVNIYSQESQRIHKSNGVRFAIDTTKNGGIRKLYACLWENGNGLEVIDLDNDKVILDTLLEKGGKIRGAAVQNSNAIWLFSDSNLYLMDSSYQMETIFIPRQLNASILDGVLVKDSLLLLAVENKGIWVYDLEQREFQNNIRNDPKNPYSVVSNSIEEIYLDSDEHLWLSSDNGSEISQAWTKSYIYKYPLEGIASEISSIVVDDNGLIWCASKSEGVFIVDDNFQVLKHFKYSTNEIKKEYEIPNIRHIKKDRDGNIWGVGELGLLRFEFKKNIWSELVVSDSIQPINLTFLCDTFAVVATHYGLLSFNPKISKLEPSGFKRVLPKGADSLAVFHYLFQNDSHYLYLPLNSRELWIYDFLLDSTFTFDIGAEVHCIWEDKDSGFIWLGTLNGLYVIQKDNKELRHISVAKGWQTPQISAIQGDRNGNLWMATNQGVWNYDSQNKKFHQFPSVEHDGHNISGFKLFSNAQSLNGQIYFGSNNGLTCFDPLKFNPYPTGPKLNFTAIEINGTDSYDLVKFRREGQIKLKHDENNIEISVIATTSFLPKLNRIFFDVGPDFNDLKSIQNGETIKLNGLQPGDYTLELQGVNACGVTVKKYILPIIILPAFWQTWWFRLTVIILLAALLFWTFRYYVKSKLRKQRLRFERQEALSLALQNERNRIAKEMHDDLGGGLTSIRLLLMQMVDSELSKKPLAIIKRVEKLAGKLVENMGVIVWALDNNNDTLIDLLTRIRTYSKGFIEDHGIFCVADIPANIPPISLGGRARRNIFLCAKECLHNILKHSNASEVQILIECKDNLILTISDNGSGIEVDKDETMGQGILNMQMRMKEIGGAIEYLSRNGTIVKLTIPLFK